MSGPTVMPGHKRTGSRSLPKEFSVATPEEFVRRFGGTKSINKVRGLAVSCDSSWFVC